MQLPQPNHLNHVGRSNQTPLAIIWGVDDSVEMHSYHHIMALLFSGPIICTAGHVCEAIICTAGHVCEAINMNNHLQLPTGASSDM